MKSGSLTSLVTTSSHQIKSGKQTDFWPLEQLIFKQNKTIFSQNSLLIWSTDLILKGNLRRMQQSGDFIKTSDNFDSWLDSTYRYREPESRQTTVLHLVPQLCPALWSHGLQPARLLCPWDSLGKNTGVGCHALLQGIFPTRNRTQDSRTAGGFFTIWATREAHEYWNGWPIPPPGDLPDPGIEPACPILQADSLPAELPGKSRLCYAHGIQQLIELF